MRSRLAARQWEMKFWKKMNSNRCSTPVRQNFPGKKVGLFGSYGWGDGEWMHNWEDKCKEDGAVLVADGVICQEEPDDDAVENCKALGKALA